MIALTENDSSIGTSKQSLKRSAAFFFDLTGKIVPIYVIVGKET